MSDEKDQDADSSSPSEVVAAATERADAEAAKKAAAKSAGASKKQEAAAEAGKPFGKKMKVKSHVNMMCKDGTELRHGQVCEITPGEHERLQKDKRGPFYDVV